MKNRIMTMFLVFFAVAIKAQQKVIPLYNGASPGSENWTYNEKVKEYNTPALHGSVVYDVSHPTLTVYPADPAINTGTAMIVCPGGGFYILSMTNEGTDVAHWLNQKGITVFVLKYRLAQSLTDDPASELFVNLQKKNFTETVKNIIPLSIADGKEAIRYVREHAAAYGVSPSRIGIMGFSAGGTVAAASAFKYTAENRPDFVAPIYGFVPHDLQTDLAKDEPPMFIAAASDDQLGLAPHSVELYSKWLAAKFPIELHMYVKGGHGFGMNKQNIPTDTWIDRFGDWLGEQGLLKPIDPKVQAHLDEDEKNRKIYADRQSKDWAFIKNYEEENGKAPAPAAGENRVVFMGNSITEWWKSVGDPAFFTGKPYYDRGISGQTSGQMLVRFREDVINLKPKVVLIMAGINDIAENNGPSKLEDVFGNIVSMAVLAKEAHIRVVLCSVMPAFRFPWRPAIDPVLGIAKLNTMIKDYCDQYHLVYCDYFTAMADGRRGLPANLSGDGVHPNPAGYKMMEPIAEKAIADALGAGD